MVALDLKEGKNLPLSVGLSANGFLYSGGRGGVKKDRPGGA